jgi:hypothetical protein
MINRSTRLVELIDQARAMAERHARAGTPEDDRRRELAGLIRKTRAQVGDAAASIVSGHYRNQWHRRQACHA